MTKKFKVGWLSSLNLLVSQALHSESIPKMTGSTLLLIIFSCMLIRPTAMHNVNHVSIVSVIPLSISLRKELHTMI